MFVPLFVLVLGNRPVSIILLNPFLFPWAPLCFDPLRQWCSIYRWRSTCLKVPGGTLKTSTAETRGEEGNEEGVEV